MGLSLNNYRAAGGDFDVSGAKVCGSRTKRSAHDGALLHGAQGAPATPDSTGTVAGTARKTLSRGRLPWGAKNLIEDVLFSRELQELLGVPQRPAVTRPSESILPISRPGPRGQFLTAATVRLWPCAFPRNDGRAPAIARDGYA